MNKLHPNWKDKGQGQDSFRYRTRHNIICCSQSHTIESVATQVILFTLIKLKKIRNEAGAIKYWYVQRLRKYPGTVSKLEHTSKLKQHGKRKRTYEKI